MLFLAGAWRDISGKMQLFGFVAHLMSASRKDTRRANWLLELCAILNITLTKCSEFSVEKEKEKVGGCTVKEMVQMSVTCV